MTRDDNIAGARKSGGRRYGKAAFSHLVLGLMALTMLAPFLWMILSSFKPLSEVENLNPVPVSWQPANYLRVFEQIPFARYYYNSLFMAWFKVQGSQVQGCRIPA